MQIKKNMGNRSNRTRIMVLKRAMPKEKFKTELRIKQLFAERYLRIN